MRFNKWICGVVLSSVLFLFPALRAAEQVQSDEVYGQAGKLVARFLQEQHFARHPIDPVVSADWVRSYMKALDYNHLFFTQDDLNNFETQYAALVGLDIAKGDLTPSYEIYKIFRQRVDAKIAWVMQRLDKPFDFTTQDFYETDRSKADWPKAGAEADLLWERRLKFEVLQDRLAEKRKAAESVKHIRKRYEIMQKNLEETDHEDIATYYLSSLASLYDPHSNYLGPKEEEDFKIGFKQQLCGIGAVLTTEDGYCVIKEIIPGGPADLCKRLHVNDRIVAVAQGEKEYVDIVEMRLRNAVSMIRGSKGTVVRLQVIPAGLSDSATHEEIKIVRDQVRISSQKASAQITRQTGPEGREYKLGVIKLPLFYGNIGDGADGDEKTSTTEDVTLLIKKLEEKGIDGLVLDLRYNGGGLLGEAVRLAGLFIDKGPVVQVKDSLGRRQVLEDVTPGMAYNGPLIVLTNRLSASASEIVAGALQNYGRAIVVGDKSTHGKGTVQTVAELNRFMPSFDGEAAKAGAMKLTIQKFYLPNGHSTQLRGVLSDIVLPSPNDYLELGESNLPHALAWDEIQAADFTRVNDIPSALIPELAKNSQTRIAKDPDFKQLLQDIERLRKRMEEKKISLNENVRVAENADDKRRLEEHKKWVKALSTKLPDVLSISFNNKGNLVEELASQEKPKEPVATAAEDEDGEQPAKSSAAETYAADLHLRETLRIMTDWLEMGDKKPMTAQAVPDSKP